MSTLAMDLFQILPMDVVKLINQKLSEEMSVQMYDFYGTKVSVCVFRLILPSTVIYATLNIYPPIVYININNDNFRGEVSLGTVKDVLNTTVDSYFTIEIKQHRESTAKTCITFHPDIKYGLFYEVVSNTSGIIMTGSQYDYFVYWFNKVIDKWIAH